MIERNELDIARSEAAFYAKTLMQFRDTLLLVRDGLDDEGDRIYFGSTNDADDLKAIIAKIDGLAWDEIMASSQPPVDLYAIIAEQRARVVAAESLNARQAEALKRIQTLSLSEDGDDGAIFEIVCAALATESSNG